MRHRCERDQSDRNEGVGLAREPVVEVAEQQDANDGAAPDAEQQPGQVGALVQPQPAQAQQHRHHQVVAHHGRERDGLDDHHPGRGRQAADEDEQREQLLLLVHRQREHEGVGVDLALREMQQAAERDRQHENVDRQHVEREQPDRLVEVLFVDVLDHRDLELARQEHDRHHREDSEPDPARVAAGDAAERSHHVAQLRVEGRAIEQIAEAVVDPERDEHADGEKGEQLDQRLEGDRRHHPLVMLGRIEMPRAEGDREGRQDQRHPECGVLHDRLRVDLVRHDDPRVLQHDGEAVRHRLQLQRDVGQDADHGDHGDHTAEQRALAVARADEVGERGDAVLLRDAQDLAHHDPPQRDHQRRADVDRQETDAVARGAPYAAVEGPCRRVHRERQAVDVGTGNNRAPGVGALVRVEGDRKQQPEVGERRGDDHPALQHGVPSAFPSPRP